VVNFTLLVICAARGIAENRAMIPTLVTSLPKLLITLLPWVELALERAPF
jgi:hypothetical protein